jgi:hypothetical protein
MSLITIIPFIPWVAKALRVSLKTKRKEARLRPPRKTASRPLVAPAYWGASREALVFWSKVSIVLRKLGF